MVSGINPYESFFIEEYTNSLPLWRKVLAKFFERFRVTKKEYDDWFCGKAGLLAPKS